MDDHQNHRRLGNHRRHRHTAAAIATTTTAVAATATSATAAAITTAAIATTTTAAAATAASVTTAATTRSTAPWPALLIRRASAPQSFNRRVFDSFISHLDKCETALTTGVPLQGEGTVRDFAKRANSSMTSSCSARKGRLPTKMLTF